MIRRFAQLLAGEVRGMHTAAYLLGIFTLASSVLAFLRDRVLAHTFGAGHTLDIYYAAFRVPDLLFVTIASLVSAYVLIPEFTKRSREAQISYIDSVMFCFFCGIVLVAGALSFAAPQLLAALFPALMHGSDGVSLVMMTRIMLLQPVLLGLSNILATIVQARGRYLLYALSPLFYNFGIILGVVVLYPIMGISGLAWGVVLGAVLHVSVPLPSIIADGFFRTFPIRLDVSAFFKTIAISLPRTLALSANHVILFAFIAFAGSLTAGSIAVFTFAFNLQSVPISIIGISYSVAAFPILAASFALGKHDEFVHHIREALRHIIFWMVPITALVIVLRAQLVRVILGSGAFNWADTRLTAAAFALLSLALLSQSVMPLLARAYYATGRSWVPFIVNAIAALAAVVMGYVWVQQFVAGGTLRTFVESLLRVSDVPGTEVLALPLAYALTSLAATLLLALLFEWEFGGLVTRLGRVVAQSLIAGLCGGAASYAVLAFVGGFTEPTTFIVVFLQGLIAGLCGLGVIIVAYALLRSQELHEAYRSVIARVGPKQTAQQVAMSAEDELN